MYVDSQSLEGIDDSGRSPITHNPVQHDLIKYIEIDRHFIKEKIDFGTMLIGCPIQSTDR